MKFIAALLCLVLLTLWVQPLLPRAAAHGSAAAHREAKSCCAKKKADAAKGCHDESEEGGGCCKDGKCNPFFTGCAGCAALAVIHQPEFQAVGLPLEYVAVQHAPVVTGAPKRYSALLIEPPERAL